jgi:hypothetical protein
MSGTDARLTGKQVHTAEMKNACYCTILAAAVLVSCHTAQQSSQTAPAPAGGAASAAPAGQSSTAQIPANTVLWVRLRKDMDSARLKAGDHFAAEVSSPVVLNGKEVVPQGTPVDGVVQQSNDATNPGASGQLILKLNSFRLGLRSYTIQTDEVKLQSPEVKAGADRAARREGAAFAPKDENLQFTITAPVTLG